MQQSQTHRVYQPSPRGMTSTGAPHQASVSSHPSALWLLRCLWCLCLLTAFAVGLGSTSVAASINTDELEQVEANRVGLSLVPISFNRRRGEITYRAFLQNRSDEPLRGPLSLEITSLTQKGFFGRSSRGLDPRTSILNFDEQSPSGNPIITFNVPKLAPWAYSRRDIVVKNPSFWIFLRAEANLFQPPAIASTCEINYTEFAGSPELAEENGALTAALWIAETEGVLKVATADGELLFEIPNLDDVRAVALDEQRQRLWVVANEQLATYGFDGNPQYVASLALSEDPVSVAVNLDDGSLWLANGTLLDRYGDDLTLIHSLTTRQDITAVSLDPETHALWVALRRELLQYDNQGRRIQRLRTRSRILDIAVDRDTRNLWVSTRKRLYRYSSTGTEQASLRIRGLEHLAPARNGALWATSRRELLRIDNNGDITLRTRPFEDQFYQRIDTLIADTRPEADANESDDTVWVATDNTIRRLDSEGERLQQLQIERRPIGAHPECVIEDVALFRQAAEDDNEPPVISLTSPTEGQVVESASLDVIGSVNESATVTVNGQTLTLDALQAFATTVTLVEGANTITVIAEDSAGNASTEVRNVAFVIPNSAPQITSQPIVEVNLRETYRYALTAIDTDGDPLTYRLITAPQGMVISSEGVITWLANNEGNNPVEVEVSDGRGGVVTQAFVINAIETNVPPVITSAPLTGALIGQTYTYTVIASDQNGGRLTTTLREAPLGMRLQQNGDFNSVITWEPINDGRFPVEVVVTDETGLDTTQRYTIEVSGEDELRPTLAPIGNLTAPMGQTLNRFLQASDPNGAPLRFSVSPTPLPANMSLDSVTGEFEFAPGADQAGSFPLTLTVTNGVYSDSETLTITVPPSDGVTRLRGQVLTDGNQPLANVRLEVNGEEVFTDAGGNYLFDNIAVFGETRLLIDGSQVDPALGDFATVPEVISLVEGADNVLSPPVFLLPLDSASTDQIRPNQTSVITSSMFEDFNGEPVEQVTLTVPSNAAVRDEDGLPYLGDITISRVTDPSLGPRPLPEEYDFSVYISIQPFGVTYPTPVPISFPNVERFAPGSRMDFFALNHDTGQMEKIGEGLVSADGTTVDSIGGVVRSNSWHGIVPQQAATNPSGNPNTNSPNPNDSDCTGCKINKTTGNLGEWHDLPSYRSLEQTRRFRVEYNSNTTNPQPIFPLTNGFGNEAPPPVSTSYQLSIDGVRVTEDIFTETRIESTGFGQFRLTQPSVQYDASQLSTGLHNYILTTQCFFPISRRANSIAGELMIHNQTDSAIGAGWAIVGIQRLYPHETSGRVMLVDGSETTLAFNPQADNPDAFISPGTDYSVLTRNSDGSFTRRMKDGMVYTFDARGFLVSDADRNNNTTTYEYDSEDRLVRITDPVGEAFTLDYRAGRLASVTDPLARTTRFEHDSRGNLIAIIEPNGDTRTFEYSDDDFLMIAQTDQRGNRKQYTYDTSRRISQATLPDESTVSFTIGDTIGLADTTTELGNGTRNRPLPPPPFVGDVDNLLVDQNGNLSRTEVDLNDIPVAHRDAVGRTYNYVRDADGEVTRLTRPNGSVVNQTYDSLGNMLTRREEFNGAFYQYSYDEFSLITRYTNPNGNRMTYNRDSQGNATSMVNELGHTTTYEYDSRGLVTRMETPNQLITTYTYNDQGLVATITETPPTENPSDVRVTTLTYDAAGQTTQIVTPDQITVDLTYDDKGRVTQARDNLNQTIDYVYDAYNNLIQTDTQNTDGNLALTVQSVFDSRNRLIEVSAPHIGDELSTQQTILDNNSNIIGTIDPNGSRSSNRFDGEDRLVGNTHRLNGITEYTYDTNDRITQVVAPNGVVTDYEYDLIARVTREISSDRGATSYTYDNNNNLLTRTDGRGITTTYTYDELERPITKTFPNSAGTIEDVTYCYDDALNCADIVNSQQPPQQGGNVSQCLLSVGRLCAIRDESGTYVHDYDAFGNVLQMVKTELGTTYLTAYQYDQGDNVIQMRYPTGRIISLGRDGVRRIQGISTTVGGLPQAIVSNIQYRADNQISQATFGNGLVDNRAYDLQGRLITQQLGSVDTRNYAYDPNGNILNRSTTPQTSDYQYDALDRLIGDRIDSGSNAQYRYDLNYNRQVITQTSSDPNSEGNTTESPVGQYTYEPFSNRISSIDQLLEDAANDPQIGGGSGQEAGESTENPISNDQRRTYNNANRWYQVFDNGQLTATYIYNAQGLRTRKVIGATVEDAETTIYHYDSYGQLIAETDIAGTPQREYLYHGMSPVAQVDTNGDTAQETLNYLHTDHLYTPRFATNNARGITWRWEGDGFGSDEAQAIATIINLRFPGQYFDEETGFHYNHNRYYDPETGRYLRSDPIGLEGSLNTYGYVFQNPIMNADPTGLICGTGACVGIGIAVGRGAQIGYRFYKGYQAARALQGVVDGLNDRTADDGISVPYPPRKRGKYTCICRVQKDGRSPDNCSNNNKNFGYGYGVADDLRTAKRQAEKMAKDTLGAKSTHHPQCRCTGPTGNPIIPHG